MKTGRVEMMRFEREVLKDNGPGDSAASTVPV